MKHKQRNLIILLAVVALLDVPLVLLAGIWALVVNAFDPTGTYTLLLWSRFLQNGGRPLLGLLVGALSIWLGSMRRAPRSTASA